MAASAYRGRLNGLLWFLGQVGLERKPIGWGPDWPVNSVVVERDHNDLDVIGDLASTWKTICCVPTNKDAIRLQLHLTREHPTLRTFRHVSKGQHLIEELESLGVDGFRLAYYPSSCQYSIGTLNKAQTLLDLRDALNAQGLDGSLAGAAFEKAYENFKCQMLAPRAN